MSIKPDSWICRMATEYDMITPFVGEKVRTVEGRKVISYGLSSYGYDIRLASDDLQTFRPSSTIDPKRVAEYQLAPIKVYTGFTGEQYADLAPHAFMLGYSVEKFVIPNNAACLCVGKSTYARCALVLNTTPLEPGWTGHITLEMSNTTDSWVRVYVNEGIGQVLFFEGDPCDVPYGDGPYQDQGPAVKLPQVGGK